MLEIIGHLDYQILPGNLDFTSVFCLSISCIFNQTTSSKTSIFFK